MVDKVTYILGAGFSAPLGIPVMRNFLIKSKDLFFSNPEKYAHFKSVFNTIGDLAIIKNYYDSDLFNIEEILSILEMGSFLEGEQLQDEFLNYIVDVITSYTPNIEPYQKNQFPSNWHDFIFGNNNVHSSYGFFVGSLFNLQVKENRITDAGKIIRQFLLGPCPEKSAEYAIVTLNYDMVLETLCNFLNEQYMSDTTYSFTQETSPKSWLNPPLAKLHGSVDTNLIIPPTWAKGATAEVTPIWKQAYQILQDSNHIRFIGYSLPISDTYIKYLIKSAVVKSKHLKSIDVICMDPDDSVRERYKDFIKYSFLRFAAADTLQYLSALSKECLNTRGSYSKEESLRMNVLEKVHNSFMETNT